MVEVSVADSFEFCSIYFLPVKIRKKLAYKSRISFLVSF